MTFVAGSFIEVRKERASKGKGKEREGKGRNGSMQRHTREVMHLSLRQGNGRGVQ